MGTECSLAAHLAEQCTATNSSCCLPDVCTLDNCSTKGELRCGFGAEQVEKGEPSQRLQNSCGQSTRQRQHGRTGCRSDPGPPNIQSCVIRGCQCIAAEHNCPFTCPSRGTGVLQLWEAVRTAHPNSFLGSLNSRAHLALEPQDWSSRCKAQLLLIIYFTVISAFTSLPPSITFPCPCLKQQEVFPELCGSTAAMLFPPEKGNSSTEAAMPCPPSTDKAGMTWVPLLGAGKPVMETNLNTHKDRGGLFLCPRAAKSLLRHLEIRSVCSNRGLAGKGLAQPLITGRDACMLSRGIYSTGMGFSSAREGPCPWPGYNSTRV